MVERSIMIFPKFSNIHIVNSLRNLYDPLADLVQPHITLVFPFESDFELEELTGHIESVLEGVRSFDLVMSGITPKQLGGNYLFLNIIEGVDEIKLIHNKLYTGILERYHRKELTYIPHLTVGLIKESSDYDEAIQATMGIDDVFKTLVDKLFVEIIGPDGESTIEYEYNLLG